jgi:hypothetical protein
MADDALHDGPTYLTDERTVRPDAVAALEPWARRNAIDDHAAQTCLAEFAATTLDVRSAFVPFMSDCAIVARFGLEPTAAMVMTVANARRAYRAYETDTQMPPDVASWLPHANETQFIQYELAMHLLVDTLQARGITGDAAAQRTARFQAMFRTWLRDPAAFVAAWKGRGPPRRTPSFVELAAKTLLASMGDAPAPVAATDSGPAAASSEPPSTPGRAAEPGPATVQEKEEDTVVVMVGPSCRTSERALEAELALRRAELDLLLATEASAIADVPTLARVQMAARLDVAKQIAFYSDPASLQTWWTAQPKRGPTVSAHAAPENAGVRLVWFQAEFQAFLRQLQALPLSTYVPVDDVVKVAAIALNGLAAYVLEPANVAREALAQFGRQHSDANRAKLAALLDQYRLPVTLLQALPTVTGDLPDEDSEEAVEHGMRLYSNGQLDGAAALVDQMTSNRVPLTNWPAILPFISAQVAAQT